MKTDGKPIRVGQIACQAGAVATAITTTRGLVWQVRREGDGLIRVTKSLAHTSHWTMT